jgi:hypothetical protein
MQRSEQQQAQPQPAQQPPTSAAPGSTQRSPYLGQRNNESEADHSDSGVAIGTAY